MPSLLGLPGAATRLIVDQLVVRHSLFVVLPGQCQHRLAVTVLVLRHPLRGRRGRRGGRRRRGPVGVFGFVVTVDAESDTFAFAGADRKSSGTDSADLMDES